MQNYKVYAYVISMEFSAVNRRRPSCKTPLGPGAKKDGCFRRLPRGRGGPSGIIMEIPGGGGSNMKPSEMENPGGWGVKLEKTLHWGEMDIF